LGPPSGQIKLTLGASPTDFLLEPSFAMLKSFFTLAFRRRRSLQRQKKSLPFMILSQPRLSEFTILFARKRLPFLRFLSRLRCPVGAVCVAAGFFSLRIDSFRPLTLFVRASRTGPRLRQGAPPRPVLFTPLVPYGALFFLALEAFVTRLRAIHRRPFHRILQRFFLLRHFSFCFHKEALMSICSFSWVLLIFFSPEVLDDSIGVALSVSCKFQGLLRQSF